MQCGRHASSPPLSLATLLAATSTTKGLEFLIWQLVSTGTLGDTNFLHIVVNLVNFVVSC